MGWLHPTSELCIVCDINAPCCYTVPTNHLPEILGISFSLEQSKASSFQSLRDKVLMGCLEAVVPVLLCCPSLAGGCAVCEDDQALHPPVWDQGSPPGTQSRWGAPQGHDALQQATSVHPAPDTRWELQGLFDSPSDKLEVSLTIFPSLLQRNLILSWAWKRKSHIKAAQLPPSLLMPPPPPAQLSSSPAQAQHHERAHTRSAATRPFPTHCYFCLFFQ